jgi:hypothetical protein
VRAALSIATLCVLAVLAWVDPARARQTTLSDNVKGYVRINAPVVVLTNVRVIDVHQLEPD